MRSIRPLLLAAALILGLLPLAPATATPLDEVVHSANMSHVANVQWEDALRAADGRIVDTQGGTDVEFATIAQRDYAIAGTYRNGLQIVDITDPKAPELVSTYECTILQGDVQIFERAGRTFAAYTADSGYSHKHSQCYADAGVPNGANRAGDGTLIIDITAPRVPRAVGFVPIPGGSHNQTVDPSGRYFYNSNSGGGGGNIEVYDISDLRAPTRVSTLKTATADDSHDLTFNAAGTRAYSAALDHTLIIDTTDLANPRVIASIEDPAITLHHQADPVTIGDREYVIINDELNGAGGNEYCPGGGLHVYDVTDEENPTKVGAFFIPEVTVREGAPTGLPHGTAGFPDGSITCTSHVFRIYEEQQLLTIAWFGAGVRVIDLSGLADTPPVSAGVAGQTLTPGMREVGFFRFVEDSDAWSAKVLEFEEDGSAYIFANDQSRGLDVFRFDATAEESADQGTWLSPAAALARTNEIKAAGFVPRLLPYCSLRGK